uniref:Uncharacterized protein n=1 Tax=Globodera rostochiensis TaxID=31243 RepID=A0A914IFA6_GLORO
MILSVAIRICAIFGSEKDQYSLEAFLTAYKCANVGESQQPMIYSYKTIDCPPLTIYSYKILPINNNGQSLNLSDKIALIKFCKTKTDSAERNFNFLLKLSDVDVTPFAIVKLAKDIRGGIENGAMAMEIDKMNLSQLAGAHFTGHSFTDYKKKNPSASMFQATLKDGGSFCLSNFLLNLLNRTLNLPNLEKYFVATNLSEELKAKQLEAKEKLFLGRFNDKYSQKDVESWKNEIAKREYYLHFEEAIHINWNPAKEMFILIQLVKYKCFCTTELYDWRRNDKFYRALHKECDEMRKNDELYGKDRLSGVGKIAADEQNAHLTPLQTLENFEQIKMAYEKLKTYLKKRVEANKKKERCTKEEEEDGYKGVVELNEEFGKAFIEVLKQI